MAGSDDSKPLSKDVEKAMSFPTSREIGQPRLMLSSSFVNELKKTELKVPNLYATIDEMAQDSAVARPLDHTQTLETIGLAGGQWVDTGTRRSKIITNYANYVIHNMVGMTWLEAVTNLNTDVKYGFSSQEIVLRKADKGPYKGTWILSHLGPRHPSSIHAWIWDKDQRYVTDIVQKPFQEVNNTILGRTTQPYGGNYSTVAPIQNFVTTHKYPIIPFSSLLHSKYNGSFGNPQGNAPAIAAFGAWQEKRIIEEYQIIGVTRDFGGIPIAYLPSELIRNAQDPENYPDDYRAYQEFQTQLENMHAGRQAFFIMASDRIDGNLEYDLKLQGIEGGGKQFDISEIVKTKTTEIYNAFGTGYMILGQGGNTSSYNLSTTGKSDHSFIVERDLIYKASLLKHELLTKLLDANNIEYSYKDLPNFVWREPDQLSLEEGGKFLQRAKSVGAATPEATKYIYKLMGLPEDGVDDLDFTDKGESRAGESGGSSGTGNTQSGGASSATNSENKQLNLIADDQGDKVALYDLNSGGALHSIVDKT